MRMACEEMPPKKVLTLLYLATVASRCLVVSFVAHGPPSLQEIRVPAAALFLRPVLRSVRYVLAEEAALCTRSMYASV